MALGLWNQGYEPQGRALDSNFSDGNFSNWDGYYGFLIARAGWILQHCELESIH
jgi:hypothetical protein